MRKEWQKAILSSVLMAAATAYLFFCSVWSLLFLIPFLGYDLYHKKQIQKESEKRILSEQFKDGLQCLLASLEAGYSVENSFLQAAGDLRMMFSANAPIVREFDRIRKYLQNGQNIEDLVLSMAERNDVEDIRSFAAIFVTAKRTGGDIIGVIRSVTASIYRKNEVRKEIETVLLAKMFEVRIMKAMPYLMLLYFRVFSPDFLRPLYVTLAGRMVMCVVYGLYVLCCYWADRLVRIEV